MRLPLILATMILSTSATALAKPPTNADRVEAQRARAEERRERQEAAREERRRVTKARRSADDLRLEGAAKRRYVDLQRGR